MIDASIHKDHKSSLRVFTMGTLPQDQQDWIMCAGLLNYLKHSLYVLLCAIWIRYLSTKPNYVFLDYTNIKTSQHVKKEQNIPVRFGAHVDSKHGSTDRQGQSYSTVQNHLMKVLPHTNSFGLPVFKTNYEPSFILICRRY